MNTKTTKLLCPICKSARIKKFWAMRGYKLAKCVKCEFVWDFLPPENTLSLYDKTYFVNENPKGGYANYFEGMRVNRKTFSDRLKRIENKLGKRGKLLDVGAALGDCLMEARSLGWKDIQGIEVSVYGSKFAKKRGISVRKGVLDRRVPANKYDVVLYQDVIEHIPDPVLELTKVIRVLKKGGFIYLVTPDIGGFWSKLLGPLWYHYKPQEHLSYFSKSSMSAALKKAGFRNIQTEGTYHVLSLEYILDRLRFYAPGIFEVLLKGVRKTPYKNAAFRAFTGEMEAWGQK